MSRTIRTLLFSTLYPSSVRPGHGIFVETRLRELLKIGGIETKVVAPVPWFPFAGERFGEYGKFAKTPSFEHRNGIDIFHPRYFLPPKIGMNIAPYTLAQGAIPTIRKLIHDGFDFDLIDAHYYYPDGIAAGMIAHWLGKPFVVTARGTDLNLIPEFPKPRRLIQLTASNAKASIGVCSALVNVLQDLGIDSSRLHVMRNGVDLERFHPLPQEQMRHQLGVSGSPLLLSVGYLIERKGHNIAIEALAKLRQVYPNARLIIIGEGPERSNLEKQVQVLRLGTNVLFTGVIPNTELASWYSAADALILCSSREGWANVLLESMACGTPVVATNIWGTPEVVSSTTVGRLMTGRTATALVDCLRDIFANPPCRKAVREHAECFSWEETSKAQFKLFSKIINQNTRNNP